MEGPPVDVHRIVLRLESKPQPSRHCASNLSPLSMSSKRSSRHQVPRSCLLCRHPCGRSESILRQRRIHAGQYVDGLEGLTQLGNEWGKTHAVVQEKFRNHPEWIWVRFEDLCHKPSKEVMELYGKLGLEWTPEIERAVREMTTTESEDFYGTNRNSENQIDKWHDALTSEQIEAIQQGCAPHGTGLYKGF